MRVALRVVVACALAACSGAGSQPATPSRAGSGSAASTFPCGSMTMSFSSSIPADLGIANQTDANCFAWQEFIGLNWPASGGVFGAPGDLGAVQWLGYMDTHQLFQPDAAPPPPWGTEPQITAECQREAGLSDEQARHAHPLVSATKFSGNFLDASETGQAFPRNAPAWIGDAAGPNVWFEVRVNRDEYDYIVQNQFYNANKQLAFYTAQNPVTVPLQLPAGCNGPSAGCASTITGAIELKAAWMEVPDPANARWRNYKVTTGIIVEPTTQKCTLKTVALVAFHIMHKTQSQPTWTWATFEHKANAPDEGTTPTGEWNFYRTNCTTQTVNVPTACQYKQQASVTTTCTPNQPPQYEIGQGCPASTPTQVTRVNPIDPAATQVNGIVQSAIAAAWSDSVWQNYELVNIVWSANPPTIPPACKTGSPGCQSTTTPQLTQSMNPSTAVANTILETYIQDHDPTNPFAKSNCLLCHTYASVPGATTPAYAADFSFALGEAQAPAGAVKTRASAPGHGKRPIRRIFR